MDALSLVIIADFQVLLGIVRDDSVKLFAYAPLHPLFVIHCPRKYRSLGFLDVSQECISKRADHDLLQHVEAYTRDFQELTSICEAKANMRNRVSRQILATQR